MISEHLIHLAMILHNRPKKTFCMDAWVCDTSACALGAAATDPVFNKLGLYYREEQIRFQGATGYQAGELFFDLSHYHNRFLFDPLTYREPYKRISIVAEWYQSHPEAFSTTHSRDVKPKHVVERINWLLEIDK